MPESDPKTLVSTEWLAEHLNAPDLRLFDASWRDNKGFVVARITAPGLDDLDARRDVEPVEVVGAGGRRREAQVARVGGGVEFFERHFRDDFFDRVFRRVIRGDWL